VLDALPTYMIFVFPAPAGVRRTSLENAKKKLDGLGWEEPLYSTTVSIFCESDNHKKA